MSERSKKRSPKSPRSPLTASGTPCKLCSAKGSPCHHHIRKTKKKTSPKNSPKDPQIRILTKPLKFFSGQINDKGEIIDIRKIAGANGNVITFWYEPDWETGNSRIRNIQLDLQERLQIQIFYNFVYDRVEMVVDLSATTKERLERTLVDIGRKSWAKKGIVRRGYFVFSKSDATNFLKEIKGFAVELGIRPDELNYLIKNL